MKNINQLLKPFGNQLNSPFIMNPSRFGGGGWDFESDFSSDSWTDVSTGSGVNTGAGKMDYSWTEDGTNRASYIDLTSVDDTAFVLRVGGLNIASHTNDTNINLPMGFCYISSNDGNTASSGTTDRLGFSLQWGSGAGANLFSNEAKDGTSRTTQGQSSITLATATLYYWQTIRYTATSCKTMNYSDSTYDTVSYTADHTIPSTIAGLRYLMVQSENTVTGGSGNMNGTIEEFKFADGVTVAP